MQRIDITPRNNWQKEVEKLGFGFHTTDLPYWDESVYYQFSLGEVLQIEKATIEIWDMCLDAVQYIIDDHLFSLLAIPESFVPYIVSTWNDSHSSLYGRFDFCVKNNEIKLLEFNADTPTSLYEAGIVQWFWLQDFDSSGDQFNSIHEKLITALTNIRPLLHGGKLYFSCVKDSLEDLTNTEYMRDCAMQAGLETQFIYIDDIGWDDRKKLFADLQCQPIGNIFKLYPWEFMTNEPFGSHFIGDNHKPLVIEPAWKMMLSNKAILPLLWELFPKHPLLLPAYFESQDLSNYVKKPFLSREGANIEIVSNNNSILKTTGQYGSEGYIYQELFELPSFNGNYPVIGSWVIGDEPAGIGIRESKTLITNNASRFVPHLIN
jgi:glutathionylspermidine synthase